MRSKDILCRLFFVVIVIVFIQQSCRKTDSPLGNIVYFSRSDTAVLTRLASDTIDVVYTLPIRTAFLTENDIAVNISVSNEALAAYNRLNGTNFKLLPDSNYTLTSLVAHIAKGSVLANAVQLIVKPASNLPVEQQYVVPITLSSKDLPVSASSKTLFILLDRVIYTSAPLLGATQTMSVEYSKPFDKLTEWTFEWRVKCDAMNGNNQTLIASGDLYTRFGDVVIRKTQLQVKTASVQFSPNEDFQPNTWYNFALTYDGGNLKWYKNGLLIMNESVSATYSFPGITVGGGGGGDGPVSPRSFNEIRFWNICRTSAEITNSLYAVDSTSNGLLGYWKCNEGKGKIFKDFSPSKNDMQASSTKVTWLTKVRMPPN